MRNWKSNWKTNGLHSKLLVSFCLEKLPRPKPWNVLSLTATHAVTSNPHADNLSK